VEGKWVYTDQGHPHGAEPAPWFELRES
jgi:hypothetical protein